MKTKLSKKFWTTLVIFSLLGQVAWVVENMYFNVFIYKMFHASAADISTMVGASAVAATLTTLVIGALSDKIGKRKLFICGGYICWGVSILGFSLIRTDIISRIIPPTASAVSIGITLVILLDCVMTFFGSSANDACFNAWLTDSTDETNRGSAEGINAMMPLVAILVVFGGFMFFDLDKQGSWISIFLIIGLAVVLIGILGFFLIEEKPIHLNQNQIQSNQKHILSNQKHIQSNQNQIRTDENQNYFKNILYGFRPAVIKSNPILYMTLAAFAMFGISIQIFMPYLILYYEKALGMSNYVMIMAPAILLAAVITAFYGRLYDKLRFKKSVIPTLMILMMGYVFLYFFKGTVLVFIGSLFMMTGYLTGMAVFGAMIRDYTPKDKAGLFQGLRIIGQVLVPGIIGPAIGAAVLANALTITNSDGTVSFIPNEKVYLAAFLAAILVWFVLAVVFRLLRREHQDLLTQEGKLPMDLPWQDYPRPQMMRDSYLNLNGIWEFEASLSNDIPKEFKEHIRVPFPPESLLSGIHKVYGKHHYLYYKKEFVIPESFLQDKVLLQFGAVDQIATIYINGNEVLTHVGGYLPFTVDITDYLKTQNTIIVRVKDTLSHTLPYGKQKHKHGGMWYTPVSGIWQTVWIESVPIDYIKALTITPTLDSITIKVDSKAKNKNLTIKTENGLIQKSFEGYEITVPIDNPIHWSPEHPYLYEFELTTEHDKITSYFALRTLSIMEINGIARLCLNEKPYFFHGLLDQGYYSDGIYLPASTAGYRRDIETMKDLGFNMLRKHIKVEPAVYYHLCDRLGMVVFQDMVNNAEYAYLRDTVLPTIGYLKKADKKLHRSKDAKECFILHAKDTVKHLYNYPSICYWTIFNEGWGQFDSDRLYELMKQWDNTRFIDSTSGWFWQEQNDVDSLHIYFKPIAFKYNKRPVVVSEFGGYSYKLDEHSYSRTHTYGYKFFTNQKEFQAALSSLYEEVALQIPNGLCASVYTQVSDVEDETNGLLTYDREVLKIDREIMRKISENLRNKC